jgi:hypothetical protein
VADAQHSDAFDGALMFFVNNQQVVSPEAWDIQTDPSDATLNRVLNAGPTTVAGLDVMVQYRTMPSQQVLRSTVFLANHGSRPVTVPFTVATNVGSDGSTVLVASSSGDTTFTDADRWLVTSDSTTAPSDPVNTHVIAGPGTVVAPPTGTSTTVFNRSETQGVLASYQVTIPAGAERGLMFFNELSAANEAATAGAARFNENPAATDELLAGLSDGQRANIVNWQLTPVSPPRSSAGPVPDGWIRKGTARYIGNDIYAPNAHRQTARSKAHRSGVRSFSVRIHNDGDTPCTFGAHGINSAHKVRVRYFSRGTNVTAAMKSAGGISFTRSPGEYRHIRVQMKINRHAAIGARKFAKVIATCTGNGEVRTDAVKAVLVATR